MSQIAVAAALAAAIVVAGGIFGYRHHEQAQAARARVASCEVIHAQVAKWASLDRPLMTGSAPVLAVLGDSYTAGTQLPELSDDYAVLTARALGMRANVVGWPGSGYVNPSACGGHPFSRQLAQALSPVPRILVIEGGTNDYTYSDARLRSAAASLVATVKREAPTTRIVLLGPAITPRRPAADMRRVDATLASVAKAEDVGYVSALSWLAPADLAGDHLHPNEAGHQVYAKSLSAALRSPRVTP
ncbi:SGNH/GDSL hydrolase family protein [Gryllotalpicola reticulitermitis]|uniref:SGNH/GDSL hydrolase family protein n=1 Tax=Gryllotalpicola reticulitermitis TaxID=1184153 RepID=A0ABV8Q4T8_9MICO